MRLLSKQGFQLNGGQNRCCISKHIFFFVVVVFFFASKTKTKKHTLCMFRERGGFSTRGGKYVLFKTLYEDKFLAQD